MKCTDCLKRETCTELCAEAEAYANQDYVPPVRCQVCPKAKACKMDYQERQVCGVGINREVERVSNEQAEKFSPSMGESVAMLYYVERKKQCEIVEITGLSKGRVSQIVKQYRKILVGNLQNAVKRAKLS